MKRVIVALLVLFLFPEKLFAAISATETSDNSTLSDWERTGLEALDEISWDWKTPLSVWHIQFNPSNPTLLGLTDTNTYKIDIWIRSTYSSKKIAATIVHELAHAFDHDYLNPELRKVWLKTRRIPAKTAWYESCDGCNDYRYGSGDFAECVSYTLLGSADKFRSKLGPPPNKKQKALILKWLRELPQAAGK